MKILTEREKKILINHAKKQELRRIISKNKRKKRKTKGVTFKGNQKKNVRNIF